MIKARMVSTKKRKGISPGMKLFLTAFPFIVLYFLFSYLPLEGWKYAFYNYKPGKKLSDCEFVGLEYFTMMFINPVGRRETIRVLKNTFVYSGLGILTSFLPMFFAIFLSELPGKKYKKFVQTVTTIPHFVSWIIVYSLAFAMFSVNSGAVNKILIALGFIEKGIDFLGSGKHVYLSMWLYGQWKGLGWGSIVYLAALGSIDQELYEAAAVDGAGRFAKIWYITIPGLLPTFITLLLMDIGNFLSNGMEQYMVFSNAFNKSKIESLDLYVYNLGIGTANIPLSTAVGSMKTLVGLVLLLISNSLSGKIRGQKIF